MKEEKMFRDGLLDVAEEHGQQAELHDATTNKAWDGLHPWLRLCHHMMEEKEIAACSRSANGWGDHEATDARDSVLCLTTFFELCSNKFNNPSFRPTRFELPDPHEDFCESIELKGNDAPMSSPDKMKTSHPRQGIAHQQHCFGNCDRCCLMHFVEFGAFVVAFAAFAAFDGTFIASHWWKNCLLGRCCEGAGVGGVGAIVGVDVAASGVCWTCPNFSSISCNVASAMLACMVSLTVDAPESHGSFWACWKDVLN